MLLAECQAPFALLSLSPICLFFIKPFKIHQERESRFSHLFCLPDPELCFSVELSNPMVCQLLLSRFIQQNNSSETQEHLVVSGAESTNKMNCGGANWGEMTSLPEALIAGLTPDMQMNQIYNCVKNS